MQPSFNDGRNLTVLLGALMVLVLLAGFAVFTPKPSIVRLGIQVQVDKVIGLTVEDQEQSLNFGIIPPGATGKRKIVLTNDQGKQLKIKVGVDGGVKDWIIASPAEFSLKPGNTQEVEIRLAVPESTEFGPYTGILVILQED